NAGLQTVAVTDPPRLVGRSIMAATAFQAAGPAGNGSAGRIARPTSHGKQRGEPLRAAPGSCAPASGTARATPAPRGAPPRGSASASATPDVPARSRGR